MISVSFKQNQSDELSSIMAHREQFSARQLVVARHDKPVLRDVSLALQAGEVLSLLGANGAGKSTFLSALSGELDTDNYTGCESPNSHSRRQPPIILNGQPLNTLCSREQARARSVLPQKSGLAFDFEVSEVVAMGTYPYPELGKSAIRQLGAEAMQHADVTSLTGRRYLELSGGEQQRVHYARAILQVLCGIHLTSERCYILLDEPTSSLDPLHQHRLLGSVKQLARHHKLGVLTILHDVNLAALFSDQVALLCDGQIVACGAPSKVLTVENLKRVYDVDACIMSHPRYPDKPLVVFG